MSEIPIRRALIAVYDKTGVAEFAKALVDESGVEIISTGGTAKHLKDAGVPVTLVEDVTGFPELLGGRVKTLHPKIFAAILADRDNPEHMRQLAEHGIQPIDMVVVNLYPFEKTVADPNCRFEDAIEMIDIGGPCLLRAAAKNHRHVRAVLTRRDFPFVLDAIRADTSGQQTESERLWRAISVFGATSSYDQHIRSYVLSASVHATDRKKGTAGWRDLTPDEKSACEHPLLLPTFSSKPESLHYGENPHQRGQKVDFLTEDGGPRLVPTESAERSALRLLSYNNYVDTDAALGLCAELTRAAGRTKLCFVQTDRDGAASTAEHPRSKIENEPGSRQFPAIKQDRLSRRKLPHWQRPGAIYWVTFSSAIGELSPEERDIVLAALKHWDGKTIDLIAAVVMTDHVHVLLSPREVPGSDDQFADLSDWLKSVKGYSGQTISQRRGGVGQVWVRESFDRWIRSERDLEEKYRYIAENPVKEGLAATPQEYPWWYGLDFGGVGIGAPAPAGLVARLFHGVPIQETVGGPHCSTTDAGAAPNPADGRTAIQPSANKPEVCSPLDAPEVCSPLDKPEVCPPRCEADIRAERVCVFIKHTNACGVGVAAAGDDTESVAAARVEAYRRAYLSDPNAAMGGILAVNFPVDAAFAEVVMGTLQRFKQDAAGTGCKPVPQAFFIEVWLAPAFDDDAVEVIRTRKPWGERVRLLDFGDMAAPPDPNELDYRKITGGMLVQTPDTVGLNEEAWKVVTQRAPDERETADLRLAWLVAKHTKSNAISVCRDGMLIGNGAGQMSRVMSCRIAMWAARENGHADKLAGAVAASDAFFPFRDGPDILIDAGVTAIIQPGGSKRDADTLAACDERNVAMVFTGTRHFRH